MCTYLLKFLRNICVLAVFMILKSFYKCICYIMLSQALFAKEIASFVEFSTYQYFSVSNDFFSFKISNFNLSITDFRASTAVMFSRRHLSYWCKLNFGPKHSRVNCNVKLGNSTFISVAAYYSCLQQLHVA